jgi:hypothetical protein
MSRIPYVGAPQPRIEKPRVNPDLPSGRGFVALLEAFRATGGTAPGEVVGRLLDEHRVGNVVSLAKLIYTGQVFGFEWRESPWIPMFQFDADDLSLKAPVQRVRAELPTLASGWALASWFAGPNERLDGCRPVDMLETDLEAVFRAARARVSADGAVAASVATLERRAREVAAHV